MLASTSVFHDRWIDYNKNGHRDVFEDRSQPINARLDDLWRQMTFQEKLAQIRAATNPDRIVPEHLPSVGAITEAAQRMSLLEAITKLNALQRWQIERTRLGIPLLFIDEGLHGLRAPQATSFPMPMALAATWNPGLMSEVAGAIATEVKARGVRQVLSPVVDVGRDSRWGRTAETYGEDPYLISQMAVAFCRAFESRGIITTPKHFVANSGEGGRDSEAQYLDERLLDELYFPPYIACIREAGSHCIMPSYGSLDGVPTVCSSWLLTEKARKEWGFRGYFGSDFGAVAGVLERHHVASTAPEVAALCLNAGMDMEWPRSQFYGAPLDEALKEGLVKPSAVEAAARRILRVKFEIGLFDGPFADPTTAARVTDSPAHRRLALEAARQALVLLKNEGNVLPLDPRRLKRVTVIGANAQTAQLGGYAGTNIRTVSLLDALRAALPRTTVNFHPGVRTSPTTFIDLPTDSISGGRGWKFELSTGSRDWGNPDVTSTEHAIHMTRWLLRSQMHISAASFHARWTGTFTPDHDFATRLQLAGTGELRLFIDGREILNNQGTIGHPDRQLATPPIVPPGTSDAGAPNFRRRFQFRAGHCYNLVVTWDNHDPDATAALQWDERLNLERDIRAAVALAKDSDAIIVAPGGLVEGEFHDRPNLGYPPEETRLIKALAATGRPLVVVLINGSAVTMTGWQQQVPAILESWQDGEEQGEAIAEALLGQTDPGGRLPISFPRFSSQSPLPYNYYALGRVRGFQDPWKGRPRYPFGYGLSYTTFAYSDLHLSSSSIVPGHGVEVSFRVRNTGQRAGDEVAQLYLHNDVASVVQPVEQLKGFQRIHLAPGESKTVTLSLTPADLSLWDRKLHFVMEPRPLTILVGSSSAAIRLEGHLVITGAKSQ